MLTKDAIKNVLILQREDLERMKNGVPRDILNDINVSIGHAVIITGIRRCGKSTLLRQLMDKVEAFYYCNFEDPRLVGFELSDFERFKDVCEELRPGVKTFFFDEIQNVPEWERFVRSMKDRGYKFFITGSNASIFNSELGTKLTGRHLTYELFPMSYDEAIQLTDERPSADSFKGYLYKGGFPEYLEQNDDAVLQELFSDVTIKDVVVRHGLKDVDMIRKLAVYLLSNAGKEFSYTGLKKTFNMGSTNSSISYVSYFEDSYLLFTLSKFSYSFKKQQVNPKKAYAIDNGMIRTVTASLSRDDGRLLENAVFLHLRKRKNTKLFYYKEQRECDFIVQTKNVLTQAIQVCYRLDMDNLQRELDGLNEAMNDLNIKDGFIVTFDQEDEFNGIKAIPAWKWMLPEAVK